MQKSLKDGINPPSRKPDTRAGVVAVDAPPWIPTALIERLALEGYRIVGASADLGASDMRKTQAGTIADLRAQVLREAARCAVLTDTVKSLYAQLLTALDGTDRRGRI